MTIEKEPRPVAGCLRCGRPHTGTLESTVMCTRFEPDKGPCHGRITWRPNPEDWTECPECDGTGVREDKTCSRCQGDAWLAGKH